MKKTNWLPIAAMLVCAVLMVVGITHATTTIGISVGANPNFTAGPTTCLKDAWTVVGDTHYTFGSSERVQGGIVTLEIANGSSSGDINQFEVQIRDHEDGQWYKYIDKTDFDNYDPDAAADMTPLIWSDIYTSWEVGSNGYAHVHFPVRGESVRFRAKPTHSWAASVSTTCRFTVTGNSE